MWTLCAVDSRGSPNKLDPPFSCIIVISRHTHPQRGAAIGSAAHCKCMFHRGKAKPYYYSVSFSTWKIVRISSTVSPDASLFAAAASVRSKQSIPPAAWGFIIVWGYQGWEGCISSTLKCGNVSMPVVPDPTTSVFSSCSCFIFSTESSQKTWRKTMLRV